MNVQPDGRPVKPHGLSRWWLVISVLIFLSPFGIFLFRSFGQQPQWSLTRVAKAAQEGQIARIDVSDSDTFKITLKNGSTAYSTKDPSSSAIDQLGSLGVSHDELTAIDWNSADNWDTVLVACAYVLPLVGIVGLIAWGLSRIVTIRPS